MVHQQQNSTLDGPETRRTRARTRTRYLLNTSVVAGFRFSFRWIWSSFFNRDGYTNGTTRRLAKDAPFRNLLVNWRVGQDSNLQPSDPKSEKALFLRLDAFGFGCKKPVNIDDFAFRP